MEEIQIEIVNIPMFFDYNCDVSIDMLCYSICKEFESAVDYYLVNKIEFKQN